MIKELLEKERLILNYFLDHLDLTKMERIIDALSENRGTAFISGVGKSGLIGKKMAATFISTNRKAFYLSPLNALHGDIGIVEKDDISLLFSKGGESEELLALIPFLRNRGVPIIGITSTVNSSLMKSSDLSITLPLSEELCPFGMIPTTSTTIQAIFADMIVIGVMKKRGLTLDEYALNHPSGKIGRRVNIKVSDLMIKKEELPTCYPEQSLQDAIALLSLKNLGCVLVVDRQQTLQGIFTDGDLRRVISQKGDSALNLPVLEFMTKTPRVIEHTSLAYDALKHMESNQKQPITALPVINGQKQLEGLIKLHDILQAGI